MSGALAVVLFFGLLLVVILVHELGHYVVARAFGFKVKEYFVGFGPRIWSTWRGGIEYGVKALPLGGYVKIAGMNPYEPVAPGDEAGAYGSKPIWQRALVIFAGPASHALVAAVLFTIVFTVWGDVAESPAAQLREPPVVGEVTQQVGDVRSPASLAGVRAGDRIVSVDGHPIATWGDLVEYVQGRPGTPIDFGLERDGRQLDISVTPAALDVEGHRIGRIGVLREVRRLPLFEAVLTGSGRVGTSVWDSFRQLGQVFGPRGVGRTFGRLFSGSPRQATDPTSVVGIGQVAASTGDVGAWGLLLYLLAVVTVFVGLVNLVPLPPFDGGHLIVLLVERVRGKPVDMRRLIPVSAVVMAFLIAFVLATVVNDITDPIARFR